MNSIDKYIVPKSTDNSKKIKLKMFLSSLIFLIFMLFILIILFGLMLPFYKINTINDNYCIGNKILYILFTTPLLVLLFQTSKCIFKK